MTDQQPVRVRAIVDRSPIPGVLAVAFRAEFLPPLEPIAEDLELDQIDLVIERAPGVKALEEAT